MASNKDSNQQDQSNPEFWEALGIKPIVVNPNDSKDVEKKSEEIADRIREASEDLKKDK